MERLRVGIIGAGGIAVQHAIAWRNHAARAELVALADISPERARHLSDQYTGGQASVHPSLDALLADSTIDVIDICLPHNLHTEAILTAARAGKAILCEKPLCTSLEDAAAIAAALRDAGAPFMMAHNQLFQPSLIEARHLLATGTLGRAFMVRSMEVFQHRGFNARALPSWMRGGESPWAWRTDKSRMGGGEVLDTGWHGTYRLLALGADRPVEVTAMMEHFFVDELSTEDTGALSVRFASGALGQMTTSWAFANIDGWHFEVAAERGSLAGNNRRLVHQLHGWPTSAERPNEPVHTFSEEIGHFIDVVQDGAPGLATFEHGARVLQLTLAAYRAAAERRTMLLPENPLEPAVPAT